MKIVKETINKEVEKGVLELAKSEPGSPEYFKWLNHVKFYLELLEKVEKQRPSIAERILKNAPLISTSGTLFGIWLMLNFEKLDVITSKAMSQIRFK